MRRLAIAPAVLAALLALAAGCGRNQGLPPVPQSSSVAGDSHSGGDLATTPRDDPGRYPAMGDRVPE